MKISNELCNASVTANSERFRKIRYSNWMIDSQFWGFFDNDNTLLTKCFLPDKMPFDIEGKGCFIIIIVFFELQILSLKMSSFMKIQLICIYYKLL